MDWGRISSSVERLIMSQVGVAIPVVFAGSTFYGARTLLKREDVNTDAGLADAYSFSVLVPASQFVGKAIPQPRQDKVIIDGLEYRVLAVERDAAGACYRIHLGEALA